MTNLLVKHPEVLDFIKDQRILSSAIKEHIDELMTHHQEGLSRLDMFLMRYSHIEHISNQSLHGLRILPAAVSYLSSALNSYPIPGTFLIKKGLYLDLRNVTNKVIFSRNILKFIEQIRNLPQPTAQKISLVNMGHIAIQRIKDPLLENQVGKIWTLDVTKNMGLSIKDIMAKQMVEDALKDKSLNLSKIIVEGTSGNTGAGLALVAAAYGIKTILVIPSKMSQEKINRLVLLGAHVIVTPTKVEALSPFSYYSVRDYVAEYSKGWKASQYDNLSNRKAHEQVTGPEIWEQTRGKITTLIATAGTCGTISGIAEHLKKKNKKIKIIAVDTMGSILYLLHMGYSIHEVEKYATSYTIQGFGEDIHPQNLNAKLIDQFIRISDADGLYMTRYPPLIGFVPGQSSGAAYAALWQLVKRKEITKNDNVVVIFPDTGIPYRKDVFNNDWVKAQGLKHILY